tara:strand:- start:225 stop:488 length:264 start_codon:yes stop_codon:yes gene_type:complete
MATKIYEDATTKELVIVRGTLESRFAAFSDLSRVNDNSLELSITHSESGRTVLDPTLFSDLQNEGGSAYASFSALKTALDGFFDSSL